MRKRWTVLLLPAALLLVPAAAFSWFDTGHIVIAEIAYRGLEPEVKARVDELVRIGADPKTNTFVTAACYLDDVKQIDGRHREWHYIDQPFSPDGTPVPDYEPDGTPVPDYEPDGTPVPDYEPDGTPLPAAPEGENVLTALHYCVDRLRDANAPPAEKAEALRSLIHLVGDVHQPLHCASRYTREHPQGDRGGNDFKIRGVWLGPEQIKNLHAYWDSGIGLFARVERPLTPAGRRRIKNLADRIESACRRESLPELREKEFRSWVYESHQAAVESAYDGLRENWKPSPDYVRQARLVARRRVTLAGYRLADLLNETLIP
jgi:hypothetical protein